MNTCLLIQLSLLAMREGCRSMQEKRLRMRSLMVVGCVLISVLVAAAVYFFVLYFTDKGKTDR